MLGRQTASRCADGFAGGAATDPTAFGHDGWAAGAVDGAIHTTAASKGRVGGVDDGVDPLDRDVALNQRETSRPDL